MFSINSCSIYSKFSFNKITDITNQSISHTAAWNVVQHLGEKIEEKEKEEIKLNKENKLRGQKEIKILFEEIDGVWISMQGDDRESTSKGKKELKLGVFYEGWEKIHQKKDRYEVINKKAYTCFKNSKSFRNIREAKIAKEYNIDEIEMKILNGDGADWIKNVAKTDDSIFQLDPFHRNQAVYRNVENKSMAKELVNKLSIGKIDESLEIITKLMIENNNDEEKMKRLGNLFNYIVNNKEGIVLYKLRPKVNLPEPPEGVKYRNLGTMEHNIHDILAYRLKNNKTSWTKRGASNLAKIITEKVSKELDNTIKTLLDKGIKREKVEEIIETVVLSASEVNKSNKNSNKNSNIYAPKSSSIPFSNCAVTNGRKAIQSLLEEKCSSDLNLSF